MDLFGEESETMWLGDGAENVQAMLAAELEFMVAEVFSFFFFFIRFDCDCAGCWNEVRVTAWGSEFALIPC